MAVFVVAKRGTALMPSSEKRVSLLLKSGIARTHRLMPFVIRVVDRTAQNSYFQTLPHRPEERCISEKFMMNSISKTILFALASLFSAGAFADSVCIKNKQGGIEVWQVADRNAVENAVPCPPAQATKSPVPQNQAMPRPQAVNAIPTAQVSSAVDQWSSTPRDLNIRNLIDTWSLKASWKLIWAVDKDIPLVSDVRVTGDFKSAVRQLLDSTTLSDVSLKPCFYTNQVVRVVRETTKCNPNE